MHPNYLFLDCEWADADGAELVSLALVSADGQHRFYAERDPLPSNPTTFVARYVYPLLDRGPSALGDEQFSMALRTFLLERIDCPVLFDCRSDGDLLTHAFAGFGTDAGTEAGTEALRPPRRPILTLMERGHYMSALLEDWFAADPARWRRRHHAAVDAEALRCAWLQTIGETDE